ncbi:GNAT family N-acetyltransferase [Streptomyces sp. NPDC048595]|uniref:GNAT family N-acetyltransferase n=1 Tax=Streptomyces sp. NPDC048595 TaxID=3365576 RepID=UPI0037106BA3
MTEITVRPLEPDGWALYRTVRLAALADAPGAFGSTLAREQAFAEGDWRERLTHRSQFLAEDDGGACGLIGIVPTDPGAAELVSLWVAPAARGRGAGDLLVREALRWANDRGRPRVRLWVTEGNAPAEHLYTRHGFRRTGRTQPVRPGSSDREFAMLRPAPRGLAPAR